MKNISYISIGSILAILSVFDFFSPISKQAFDSIILGFMSILLSRATVDIALLFMGIIIISRSTIIGGKIKQLRIKYFGVK